MTEQVEVLSVTEEIVVVGSALEVVEVTDEEELEVVEMGMVGPSGKQGDQGPQGAPGPAGDPGPITYQHIQAVAAQVWYVVHNLGYRPAGVRVFDNIGREWTGRINHLSVNDLTITFTVGAFAGKADLS